MDLSGYVATKSGPAICGNYSLSGEYVSGDYIEKTFTGLNTNHYELVVRFGIGYIGVWTYSDQMQL